MKSRLPLVPMLTLAMLASSLLSLADGRPQEHDAAVARAEPAPIPARPDAAVAVLPAPEVAVRKLIASYGRAIETQDVELFRAVMPDLTVEAEERLRGAFRTIRSQQVGLSIDSVDIDGPRATVRVSRQDTVDGLRMKPIRQDFHLVRHDDRWQIRSLSLGR